MSGDNAIAEEVLAVEAEFRRAMGHERIELHEGAGVQQQLETLAGRQLAPRMLTLHAHGSPTQQGLGAHALETCDPIRVLGHVQGFLLPPLPSLRKDAGIEPS